MAIKSPIPNPLDNLFEQMANISKAGAYDIVAKQRDELLAENERITKQAKELREALIRAKDWFYAHGKKDGKIYADGVKPSCIPYIETALNKQQ